MEFVGEALAGGKPSEATLPVGLRGDRLPRIVFLSVSDGESPARVVQGAGRGLLPAVRSALAAFPATDEARWIKLDIVLKVDPARALGTRLPAPFERSLHGLVFSGTDNLALLPEELVSHGLVDNKQQLQRAAILRYLQRRSPHTTPRPSSSLSPTSRFTTLSLFTDGDETLRLYRGHRTFGEPSREELLAAATEAGRYLTRSVKANGRFVYQYFPTTDTESEDYNITRHAGTAFSMMELYGATRDPELLEAAERAVKFMADAAQPITVGGLEAAALVDDDVTYLGANALAALALAEYAKTTGNRQYVPLMLRFGRYIQGVQREDGSFIQGQEFPSGRALPVNSPYFPGEALFALLRAYLVEPVDGWLDVAEKGAQYLINVRDAGLSIEELPNDHWLMYALNELHRLRPQPLYLQQELRLAQAIPLIQHRNPEFPDWFGGYYFPPRSTPAATRSEAMAAAYRLARDFGETEAAEAILASVKQSVRFQLQTQFRPESAMYLQDPQRVLGGFHGSLTEFDLRNDYSQHSISSLLALAQILEDLGE